MPRTYPLVATTVAFLLATHGLAADSIGLKLALTTTLGVKATVDVGSITADHPLINRIGGYCAPYSREPSKLTLQINDKAFILIPWAAVKEITSRDKKHVVTLQNGTEHIGKLRGTLEAAEDREKKYDLSGATSIKVVAVPNPAKSQTNPSAPANAKKPSEWTLAFAGSKPMSVRQPRFVLQYYSSSGYLIGGSDRETTSTNFFIIVDKERTQANLDDFAFLEFRADKSSLTVKAKDGDPVTGTLELSANDSKGDHTASSWLLVVELADGCSLAVSEPNARLERK